eukprot:CAMPEP_0114322012 /NCGR_PEP_ID=MMETSP0059-20121206/26968_1 /TAXON_ID=36894 /ORGANISM="Pyramimonas parkeae, Strain CCMP726" /LENGTH=139 /DNA_ID=CAMNT_0001449899 /DNA_START=99 /DNA_END=517 /DNA_ORIENTATION=+
MVQGAQGLVDKAWGLNFWTSIHLQGGLVASKWLAEDRQAPLALVQGRAHIQTQLLHAAEPRAAADVAVDGGGARFLSRALTAVVVALASPDDLLEALHLLMYILGRDWMSSALALLKNACENANSALAGVPCLALWNPW